MQEASETKVQSLGHEDPLEDGTVTHSSSPARESNEQRSLAATVHRMDRTEANTLNAKQFKSNLILIIPTTYKVAMHVCVLSRV